MEHPKVVHLAAFDHLERSSVFQSLSSTGKISDTRLIFHSKKVSRAAAKTTHPTHRCAPYSATASQNQVRQCGAAPLCASRSSVCTQRAPHPFRPAPYGHTDHGRSGKTG